ncbi:MAG: ethanolamine utilization protein EutH [Clostridiaceae bacterium]|nr:ethanolamine utilization protein EutH [Clostridiaceae bacterium]
MTINQIIMFIMAVGILIGGADCILNNKFGLGEKFEEGFMCLGPTALSMVGIICLAPKIAHVLQPVIVPVFRLAGADPAMFASVLALDMGGYPLAMALAEDIQIGYFSGLVVSAMLGATIVFTIPVGLGMIEKEDHVYFAKGLLIGLIPVPVGSIVGGLLMGLPLPVVLVNLIPILIIGILLVLGLLFAQDKTVKGFIYFGRGIRILTVIGLSAAAFEYMTGIVLIPGMPPIMEGMETVADICIVLLGSMPLMSMLLRFLRKPFEAMGARLGLDSASIAGMLFSCISAFPTFRIIKDMCPKGKVVTTAFFVSSLAVFSAHLGFTAGVNPEILMPMMAAKLLSGFLGVGLALIIEKGTRLDG